MLSTTWVTLGVFTVMGTGYLAGHQAQPAQTILVLATIYFNLCKADPSEEDRRNSVEATTAAPTAALHTEDPQPGGTFGRRRQSLSMESVSETDASDGEYAVDLLENVRRLLQRCGGAGPNRGS